MSRELRGSGMEGDIDYFARRATEEKAAANSAEHALARQAHLDLAERYDDLANSFAADEQRLGIGLSDSNVVRLAAGADRRR